MLISCSWTYSTDFIFMYIGLLAYQEQQEQDANLTGTHVQHLVCLGVKMYWWVKKNDNWLWVEGHSLWR